VRAFGSLGTKGLFGSLGRLLRVLPPLFAHSASLWGRPSTFLLLVVSVARGCHARDQAGARGRHEEERDHAHCDGARP
jgi:cytochrome c-type biogenesis protein CcmH/NrfF